MKIKIHILTSDTDAGLLTDVFPTERELYERLINLHELDDDDAKLAKDLLATGLEEQSHMPKEEQEFTYFCSDLYDLLEDNRQHMDSFNITSEVIDISKFQIVT